MINTITTVEGNDVVRLFAGASGDDKTQGQLVVWTTPLDPCAAGATYDGTVEIYLDPVREGPLEIASAAGGVAVLGESGAASLSTRKFDYLSGVWEK